jgi:hypothetical protein
MPNGEDVTGKLRGMYCDVLRNAAGQVTWESGWRPNVIVVDCRRLLAGLMRSAAGTLGIQGLQVGAGNPAWDQAGTPAANPNQTSLEDTQPHTQPVTFDYVDEATGAPTGSPTRRLQIRAVLGTADPPWPEPGPNPAHPTRTLREFGLVGSLNGSTVLINYVRHPAIVKDPASTLERTIWLVF